MLDRKFFRGIIENITNVTPSDKKVIGEEVRDALSKIFEDDSIQIQEAFDTLTHENQVALNDNVNKLRATLSEELKKTLPYTEKYTFIFNILLLLAYCFPRDKNPDQNNLSCPITLQPLTKENSFVLISGHWYTDSALIDWVIDQKNPTNPMTREVIQDQELNDLKNKKKQLTTLKNKPNIFTNENFQFFTFTGTMLILALLTFSPLSIITIALSNSIGIPLFNFLLASAGINFATTTLTASTFLTASAFLFMTTCIVTAAAGLIAFAGSSLMGYSLYLFRPETFIENEEEITPNRNKFSALSPLICKPPTEKSQEVKIEAKIDEKAHASHFMILQHIDSNPDSTPQPQETPNQSTDAQLESNASSSPKTSLQKQLEQYRNEHKYKRFLADMKTAPNDNTLTNTSKTQPRSKGPS